MIKRIAAAVFIGLSLAAVPLMPASAQELCPGGAVSIVRVNAIKSTSSRAAFDQAVKAHLKWYRDHSFKDNEMEVMNVIAYDQASKTASVSKTEVMTIHYNAPGPEKTMALHDAAWDAYVKMYRDSSDITDEHFVCMPKHK